MKKGSAEVIDFGAKADAMRKKIGGADKQVGKMGGSLTKLSNVSRQTRAKIQNVSYQLQDMAVQAQMGTKATTILSQQLPQLASAFGAAGAVVGVLAGVGIPALAYAFKGVFEQAESTEDALKGLKEALDTYSVAAGNATMTTEELRDKFGVASEGLRTAFTILEQISRSEAQSKIDGIGESLAAVLGTAGDGESRGNLADFFDVNIMFAFTDAQRAAREEARLLTAEFQANQRALASSNGNLDQQITSMRALLSTAQSLADATGGVNEEERALIKSIAETLVLMEQQKAKTREVDAASIDWRASLEAVLGVAVSLDSLDYGRSKIMGAVDAARSLASNLYEAAKQQAEVSAKAAKADSDFTAYQYSQYGAGRVAGEGLASSGYTLPTAPSLSGGGGGGSKRGGSRGRSRDFQAELETLKAGFATEYEAIQSEYDKQMLQLEEFRANKVATEEEFNELEQRIKAEHNEKLAAMDKAASMAKLGAVSGALGDVASLMSSENKKIFKIGQVAALAEATVSGYKAAVKAWEKGMDVGGPPVAAAFTAASLAKTGALISGIASQSATGSGSSGASTSAAGAPAQAAGLTLNLSGIQQDGNLTVSPSQLGGLVEQVVDYLGDTGRAVTVNA